MESEYGDIPLHCEVRWPSAGNCSKSFFALRSEVFDFLKSKNIGQQFYEDLKSISFMKSLAFLTDLTSHLNILNLKLQELITEFNSRFKDFYILKPKFELFSSNPMTVDISVQPPDFQIELCDLQADCFLQSKVIGVVSSIYGCVVFYEYILLIIYIKWMVYTINEQIPKNKSTICTFRDLYLEVIECLNDINRTIYGLPAIVSFIAANFGLHIFILFYKFLFTKNSTTEGIKHTIILDILTIIIRAVNIILLYGIGQATVKEINWMSVVLHQRSVIERNPRIKLQIKFFILRRYYEHYHFVLYGIYEIDPRQLLMLANKAFAYLVIQILFKLNKK
ncbi:uncharacterized protein LOC111037854 [Myzus persicae]|uniref:uncharacterized protein LOC111037854 n=1 Tax=Myzus persicae TaxID=13164 RepID=UPI000B9342CA|nr:uncharacterized protein LOC111037854 [Myzus persicae]